MAQYMLSVHSVAGQGGEPMTEEQVQDFMQRVGILETDM
jgi:hypothetical protein